MKDFFIHWGTLPFAFVLYVTLALFWVIFERKNHNLGGFLEKVLKLDEI